MRNKRRRFLAIAAVAVFAASGSVFAALDPAGIDLTIGGNSAGGYFAPGTYQLLPNSGGTAYVATPTESPSAYGLSSWSGEASMTLTPSGSSVLLFSFVDKGALDGDGVSGTGHFLIASGTGNLTWSSGNLVDLTTGASAASQAGLDGISGFSLGITAPAGQSDVAGSGTNWTLYQTELANASSGSSSGNSSGGSPVPESSGLAGVSAVLGLLARRPARALILR